MKLPSITAPSRDAFTLVELLTVLAIMGLLIPGILAVVSRAKLCAKRTQCVSNLHQTGLAFENCDRASISIEEAASWAASSVLDRWLSLSNGVNSAKVFHCPADNRFVPPVRFSDLTPADISFALRPTESPVGPATVLATDGFISDRLITRSTVDEVYWETRLSKSHGAGVGNVLFADASVSSPGDAALRQALRETLQGAPRDYVELLMPGMASMIEE